MRSIPDLPADPRAAAVLMARERLTDLKLAVAVASGIAMVALTGAVAYSTSVAVAASTANGTLAPSGSAQDSTGTPAAGYGTQGGSDNTVAPAPATTAPSSRGTRRSSGSSGAPPRTSPRIVTAQS
jgi:hypothetical protein